MTLILIFTIFALILGIIDGSLPLCLGDSVGSTIGAAGSGGLGFALPGLGGGGLGALWAPNPSGASTSI